MKYQDLIATVRAMYPPGADLIINPFSYQLTFLALAQGAQAQQNLAITANADFILSEIAQRAQIGAVQTLSTVTAPFVRMLITDSGSNSQFTQTPVDLITYASNAECLREFPFPRRVQGRTNLAVTVSNYAPTAETYTSLDITFNGVLVQRLG